MINRTIAAPAAFARLQPSQQRWIVTGLVTLVAAFIAQQGIFQPLRHQRVALERQVALAQQRMALLQSLDTTHHELLDNRRRLRARGESASLLQEVTALAATHEVVVNSAAPQPARPAGRYAWLPVRFAVAGTYAHLLQFLHALETAPKPILVEQVDIAPSTAPDWSTIASQPLEAQVVVSALMAESS